jgi:TonB family protein
MQCLYRAVIVVNDSDDTLECKGQITYDGVDMAGNKQAQAQALVSARSSQIVAGSLAKDDISASVFDAVCTPRAKLAPLDTPANCKYEVVKPVAIGDYYPPASREAGQEGPVTVEFTVAGKAGNPTNVRAVASSMYPALDQAAVKAVSDMVMSSNCPKARYRLKLSFMLD